jgi:MFS transporter, DHA3 family, macrolide efflux protein
LKKFFILWSSQAASLFGSAIVGFSLAWYLARETGSATILSTAMLVNYLPAILLGPFIGPFIDRWDRKKIMIFSDLFTAFLTLVLVVLFFTDTIQVWHIYAIMAGRAAGGACQYPALQAAIPMIVPEKQLSRINGLLMMLRGAISLVAPVAGAFLMEALDMQWVLSVDIITAIIAVGCLLPLAIPKLPPKDLPAKPSYLSELKQGFRYVISWRGLAYLVVLAVLINFLATPVTALLPLFVKNNLGGDVLKLGWLQTASGAGIIAGGLILGAWGGFKRRTVTSFTAFLVWSIVMVVFGLMTESLFFLALALMFISGLVNSMGNAPFGAIFQSVIARNMQGRFHALYGSVITAMVPVALLIAGPVSDAIGLPTIWYISGSAIFVLFAAAFFSKDLMNIEKHKPGEPVPADPPPQPSPAA